jgi:hypothetical protein
MVCMCVSLVKASFQTVMGRILALEYMLSGACGLSHQVINVIAPRGPDAGRAYPVAEALGWVD